MIGSDILAASGSRCVSGSDWCSSNQETDSAERDMSAEFAEIFEQWMLFLDGWKGQDTRGETSEDGDKNSGLQKLFAGFVDSVLPAMISESFFPAGHKDNSGVLASPSNGIGQYLSVPDLIRVGLDQSELNIGQAGILLPGTAEKNNFIAPDAVEYKRISDLLDKLSGELQAMSPAENKAGIGLRHAVLQNDSLAGKGEKAAQPAQMIDPNSIKDTVPETVGQNIQGFPAESEGNKNSFGQEESRKDNKLSFAVKKDEVIENSEIMLSENTLHKNGSGSIVVQDMAEHDPVAASTVKPAVWEQITAGIQRHISAPKQEITGFEIQLHPENLGKIKLNLHWESGQVHIQCHASEAMTFDLLQQNLGQLRQFLQESGISCGMLQMGLGEQHKEEKPKEEQKITLQAVPEEDEQIILPQQAAYGASKSAEIYQINLTA